jgi:hypothetical protein
LVPAHLVLLESRVRLMQCKVIKWCLILTSMLEHLFMLIRSDYLSFQPFNLDSSVKPPSEFR